MRRQAHRLVFVDETGTTTKVTRSYGRCRHGWRLKTKAPFGHRQTQTFIAGLRSHGLTAPGVIDGPMNRRLFAAYVETQLAPTLSNGDIVNLLHLGLVIVGLPYSRQGRTILDEIIGGSLMGQAGRANAQRERARPRPFPGSPGGGTAKKLYR
jgi:hypothetical protein